ncbi:hypothetical protein J7E97_18980 [Streptomyces sp. ISL-66]|uniref:hypothetical protein n=1 Tax=Streptomyces sp. ISL-66 TaxID=2819186 RepID=UPI001BECDA38|nr:hypothetical protein [Streptomyces sp. ISL-66]MBT2469905.1 hypothetical protein [Streptomyces sp. ISL-66]
MKIGSQPDYRTAVRGTEVFFTVTTTLQFTSAEVRSGFQYGWRVEIWEDDKGAPFGGQDDRIYRGKAAFFTVDSTEMNATRRISISASAGALDTESGDEEIYTYVTVWNDSTDGVPIGRRSVTHSFGF